jgi:hypothetical protein
LISGVAAQEVQEDCLRYNIFDPRWVVIYGIVEAVELVLPTVQHPGAVFSE